MSGRMVVTEADRQRADRLIDAMKAKDRDALAFLLAEIRTEALLCADVRAERKYEPAKQPGLPFDERAALRQPVANTGKTE